MQALGSIGDLNMEQDAGASPWWYGQGTFFVDMEVSSVNPSPNIWQQ